MINLSTEQEKFLIHHKIPLSEIFDATNIRTKDYKEQMKEINKLIAIGVTPCEREGHTMRDRHGHCVQCDSGNLEFLKRHYKEAKVYIAASIKGKLIKVGSAKDLIQREKSLINSVYGGYNDRKILFSLNSKDAGKVEFEIQNILAQYQSIKKYPRWGKEMYCYELFACSYPKAKSAINEIIAKYPHKITNLDEIKTIDLSVFNFPEILNQNPIRYRIEKDIETNIISSAYSIKEEQRKEEQRKEEQRKEEQRKEEQRKEEQRKEEQRKEEQRKEEQRKEEQRKEETVLERLIDIIKTRINK